MKALHDFAIYLAQAHRGRFTAPVDAAAPFCRSDAFRDLDETKPCAENPWPALGADRARGTGLPACRVNILGPAGGAQAQARLQAVRRAMDAAPVGLLLVENFSPEGDSRHLLAAFADAGLQVAFFGKAPAPMSGAVAVLHGASAPPAPPRPGMVAPDDFRVLAIVPTYNEEDVIAQTLRDLLEQGLEAYLIDNWSTDRTVERASAFLGRGLVGLERFPPHGPSGTYDLAAILSRVEQVAHERRWARWAMLHDADERRRSPWPGVRLREALWHVDRSGFSCVDHVTLNFCPVDDSFDPDGADLEAHFPYFSFSDHPGHFHQRRAWKQSGARASLAPSAGHDVMFPGRRVYPYKFLLKHYPIRSQAHGERKILRERLARWNREERARGWHRQYDELEPRNFIRSASTLTRFDPEGFWKDYLVERLSGAGIFSTPPPWATPPHW